MVIDGKTWYCLAESCYHFSPNERITKPEADDKCEELGSHVLALETAQEWDDVLRIMNTYGKTLRVTETTFLRDRLIILMFCYT